MSRLTSIVLIALMSVAAHAREKQPDILNVAPQAGHKSILFGSLTAGSPTYDRAVGSDVGLECSALFTDSANDGMHLDILCMESSDYEPIELILSPTTTNIADTVLTIYCRDWDPSVPLDYGIAFDDDSGEGLLSAITYEMGVRLLPGDVHWVVISTYAAGMTGSYELLASPNLSTCNAVSVEHTTWGALKSTYR